MIVKIVGYNGYLGRLISKELREHKHEVFGIRRELLYGDNILLQNEIRRCDIVINVAGANIMQRWTSQNKVKIYNSRVRVTQQIVKAINALPLKERPKRFIQTSAIGKYTPGVTHTELSTDFATDFLGRLVNDWEAPLGMLHYSVEKTIFRLGLVLGKQSKIIKYLSPLFRLGLGAKISNGNQPFPFIHEYDLKKAFLLACEGTIPSSVYNLVAPESISNKEFTQALAAQVKRRYHFTVPAFSLRFILGGVAKLLLISPSVDSSKISETAYVFRYPTIELSLKEIMSKEEKISS